MSAGDDPRVTQVTQLRVRPTRAQMGSHTGVTSPASPNPLTCTNAERAFLRLHGRLVQLDGDGIGWPCRGGGDLWFSEVPADRALAVELCIGCPALTACGRYADAARERHGVWGGKDRTPPRRKGADR